MRGPKIRKSNDSDPFTVALRLLTYRDRSTTELTRKLRERGFGQNDIDPVLNRCLELGYLSDERFAFSRARALVSSGRAVGIRALNELKKAGVAIDLAERALAEAETEQDLPDLMDEIRRRKFPDFEFDTATEKEKNRVLNFFRRRGFPVSMILTVLKSE